MTYISETNFLVEASFGEYANYGLYVVNGHNHSFSSGTDTDIWEASADLVYLNSAETMEIASTSTNDTNSAGTGARQVLIKGLDENFDEILETVNLNGTTDVTTVNSYLRVLSLEVTDSGSQNFNDGDITATATTTASVQCFLDANESVSNSGHFTIRAGCIGYIQKVEYYSSKLSGGGTPILNLKIKIKKEDTNTWVELVSYGMDTSTTNQLTTLNEFANALPEKTDIRATVSTDTATSDVRCRMFIICKDD